MVNNSSVDQYAIKPSVRKHGNEDLQYWCTSTENLIATHLDESATNMMRYIRNLPELILLLLNVTYNMEKEHGSVILKSIKTKDSGIWM